MKPELIVDYACHTGEGPLWHPDEQCLFWLDIPRGRLFRYDPNTGDHAQVYEGEAIGGFTIQEDGALLLFGARGRVAAWRNGEVRTVIEEIPEELNTRFNDVIADPLGRVFCGTMSSQDRPGHLYRLDPDGSLTILLEGLGTPNGMGFSLDRKRFYFTDSRRRTISRFDYDEETGKIARGVRFHEAPEGEGSPDGMTVDAEGHIWSARWDGNCLLRLAPDGAEELRIPFPARKVSSVTFGGPDYSDIYVTTAGGHEKETEGPGAGALFRLRTGGRGLPEFRSRIE